MSTTPSIDFTADAKMLLLEHIFGKREKNMEHMRPTYDAACDFEYRPLNQSTSQLTHLEYSIKLRRTRELLVRESYCLYYSWTSSHNTYLRYDAFKELVPRPNRHPNAGQAEAQALHASDGAGDSREDDIQHDVFLEAALVAVYDPSRKKETKTVGDVMTTR